MTVCIAAICESGKKIVVATDRMLTIAFPVNLEFESDEPKIKELSSNCLALASGSTAYAAQILDNSYKKFGGTQALTIDQASEIVRAEYVALRMSKTDETIVNATLGGDYQRYLQRGGTLPDYLQRQAQVFQQLAMLVQQFNLSTDVMLALVDDVEAHISMVTHPGTIFSLDKVGYGAIGSGGMHATIHLSLGGQSRRRSFVETLYEVYAAKKVSEVAPGVGQATDLAIVESKKITRCTEPVMKKLQELFEQSTKKQSPQLNDLQKIYDEQPKT
jgi:ATP-dependent protease HslVU (ClpYQ) peptidase subunit